jgi:hypothetical protein
VLRLVPVPNDSGDDPATCIGRAATAVVCGACSIYRSAQTIIVRGGPESY